PLSILSIHRRRPGSPLFPYTTLFRSKEFLEAARMKPGQILVVGCSSSEIENFRIGTCSSRLVGERVYQTLSEICREKGIYLAARSEEHTSELQSRFDFVCRLLLEKKK